MEKIIWSEDLSVGVREIDEQHKVLIKMLNTIYDYFIEGQDFDIIAMEKEIWEYTKYHFATEEKLMKSLSYPETDDHLIEHSDFIGEIFNIRESGEIKETATMNVLKFLSKWLYNHILTIDKKLGKFIQEKTL